MTAEHADSHGRDSASVRRYLIDALRLDLVGPFTGEEELQCEQLPYAPSRWYLTGYLAPAGAKMVQLSQDTEEEQDEPVDPVQGGDDASPPERGSGKRVLLPSSMGMSVLVDKDARKLEVEVCWGDYLPTTALDRDEATGKSDVTPPPSRIRYSPWTRRPRSERLSIDLAEVRTGRQTHRDVDGSDGLQVVCMKQSTQVDLESERKDVWSVSLFVVNRRRGEDDMYLQDRAFAFQVELKVGSDQPFVKRFDPRGFHSKDWDERLADLHYRDAAKYAVGHNVSTAAEISGDKCNRIRTIWMPQAHVGRVEPSTIDDVEFDMRVLGDLASAEAARQSLMPLVSSYREWIVKQQGIAELFTCDRRKAVATELVEKAKQAADRIQGGIESLENPLILEAFRVANRAMGAAGRRRIAQEKDCSPAAVDAPGWRPFQIAFILMNIRGIADPTHKEREIVDLLFFPTGGGKTEAYLGLAAFTLVLRRLQNPAPVHLGLSVLMRYTLRLLTLDQLGRAAAIICALELERESNPERLGTGRFEIALWVGRAATPNHMGKKGDSSRDTARARTLAYCRDSSREPPLPLDRCPWCGTRFGRRSFNLIPNPDNPTNLEVTCAKRNCDFAGNRNRPLPIVAVDEPIYQRLPAFMIATADKFAGMPWTGETARFFRGGDADDPRPPDLIIQDELHLISGPLGTMAGLYETAIDHLCRRSIDGRETRPKIIASTATVRLARKQIRALFGRSGVAVFPSPGIDRSDSFFARQDQQEDSSRIYLGIAAQGRGPKVVFLRTMITLMAAAQAAWDAGSRGEGRNPADPYMTVAAYFNTLRELGSSRRIVEDEIGSRLPGYGDRKRVGENDGMFADRKIDIDPVELTSRVGTAEVAEAKRRLSRGFAEKDKVDVALATNMISVGLDIARLGLMVVSGQPKTTAEYIQATSRVGRDRERPGLVITLLNIHRARDRSHYERFASWHESFYRSVEAASVTPFSSRALDRGLPAVMVALARLGIRELRANCAAKDIVGYDDETAALAQAVGDRARNHADPLPEGFGDRIREAARKLIDDWKSLASKAGNDGETMGYTRGKQATTPLLREMIDPDRDSLGELQLRFRAPRSLRDVEPGVLLNIRSPEGKKID